MAERITKYELTESLSTKIGPAPQLLYLLLGVLVGEILNHIKTATQPWNHRKLIMYSAVSIFVSIQPPLVPVCDLLKVRASF